MLIIYDFIKKITCTCIFLGYLGPTLLSWNLIAIGNILLSFTDVIWVSKLRDTLKLDVALPQGNKISIFSVFNEKS